MGTQHHMIYMNADSRPIRVVQAALRRLAPEGGEGRRDALQRLCDALNARRGPCASVVLESILNGWAMRRMNDPDSRGRVFGYVPGHAEDSPLQYWRCAGLARFLCAADQGPACAPSPGFWGIAAGLPGLSICRGATRLFVAFWVYQWARAHWVGRAIR